MRAVCFCVLAYSYFVGIRPIHNTTFKREEVKMRYLTLCLLALLSLSSAHAGVIYQATSISSPDGSEVNNPISRLIDQSGLSASYISGITDFDSFTSSTTAAFIGQNNIGGVGGATSSTATFDFFLGSIINLGGMAIWNQAGTASLRFFDVFGSTDGSTFSFLTSGEMPAPSSTTAEPAHIFSWAPAAVSYIRLVTLENFGFSTATRLNEVAFNQVAISTVPTSGSLAFLLFCAAGIFATSRSKKLAVAN